ncbi:MAG: sugar phosphate isomerase/epimerase [Phycisphaeraceae bacterium]|nr:sugar phosphate isomerase/epimerase [Phycisphaeraceae bacterium]
MKLAFSTVACPEWTLERVAQFAEEAGYQGVELRTFGSGTTRFACDPALTDPEKTRRLFAPTGCQVTCVATSARFDDAVTPPLVGHVLGGTPRGVIDTGWAVDLAARLEAPLVRVFAYQIPASESRSSGIARIVERLELAVATARNTGVRLAIENGGSFPTAATLSELLDRISNPLLGAAYSPSVAALSGEDAAGGINVLADRLFSVKLKDYASGKPCELGRGESHPEATVRVLADRGFPGWVVYEYDRAWITTAVDASQVLRNSAKRYFEWSGGASTPDGTARGVMSVR